MKRGFTLVLLVAALGLAIQLAAFWPGIMVWDAIRQYGQALTGHYDDWHPPAMNWLWRELGVFGAGPAPMLVVQAGLYWTGFVLIACAMLRRGRRWSAALVMLAAFLPVPFVLVGSVLKDSLMAGALLVAAGLIAIRREEDRVLRILAFAFLLCAATLRFNAVPACAPLAVALLPRRWWDRPWRFGVALVAVCVPLALALPLANRALDAKPSGVGLSLVIYDLGGITHFSGADAFPPTGVPDQRAVAARCWNPRSWDSYAWWTDAPCPVGFERVKAAFERSHVSAYRWWAAAVVAHPIGYAEHRLAHSNDNLRAFVDPTTLPSISTQTDPNPWGFQVPPSRLRDWLNAVAIGSLTTISRPILWLLLAAALILSPFVLSLSKHCTSSSVTAEKRRTGLRQAQPERGGELGLPLAWSSLLYALSYVPLSVASEVRYHVWTMSAAALAAAILVPQLVGRVRTR